jgi:phage regulator Rha-like protein
MKENKNSPAVPEEILMSKIYYIRGQKVMLDRDLAELYEAETKQLKRQVNRNTERFPLDFMFELTPEESSRCQIGTLNRGENIKYLPYAFTEQGVAMLSGVLNSKRAIAVNIQIMRAFTRLRQLLLDNTELHLAIAPKGSLLERNKKQNSKQYQEH